MFSVDSFVLLARLIFLTQMKGNQKQQSHHEIHKAKICKVSKKSFFFYKSGFVFSFQVLHYAQELFEGMKAYRGVDDQIRMFRPMHNMARYKHELVGARRA